MRPSHRCIVLRVALVALLCGGVVASSMAQSAAGGGAGTGGGAAGAGAGGGAGTGGGGNSGGGSRASAGMFSTTDPGVVASTVKALSRGAQDAIDACDFYTTRCVADALDNYAAALRRIAPRLPPPLRSLPDIVAKAATRVRIARTKDEAIRAVRNAIAEVHKSIALLKADDPITLKAETREGAFVVDTLQVADDKLERAVGL